MVSVLAFLLIMIPVDDAHLEQGRQLKLEGRLFMAEGHFLRAEPTEDQIPQLARDLGDIALRSNGNTKARRDFYRSYLTRSRPWRGTAALVLAGLSFQDRDMPEFLNSARLYLKEFESDALIRLHLIYHLARHSSDDLASLGLSGREAEFFKIAKAMPSYRDIPNLEKLDVPYFYKYLHRLERGGLAPAPGDDAAIEDTYLFELTRLREAMGRFDEVEAAEAINAIAPLVSEADRPDLDVYYYPLLQEFFLRRNETADAVVVGENLALTRNWTFLPFEGLPAYMDLRPVIVQENVEPEEPVKTVTPPRKDESLEAAVWAGRRGLELALRKLPTNTEYEKIMRNYLLGTYHLKGQRYDDAFDRLRVAESQVSSLPFPSLEAKIFLALADYHEARDYQDKADWYRLEALQIEKTPRYLPLMHRDGIFHYPASAVLIDGILAQSNVSQEVGRLINYHEQAQFMMQMERAYGRNVLLNNPLVGKQLKQIGDQLIAQVNGLATNPLHSENPALYNNTVELWTQLWTQLSDYYKQTDMPAPKDLQARLNNKDRIVAFLEGRSRIGVVILSNSQALALSLGTKSRFLQLPQEERLNFLEARLGPIWNRDGRVEGQLVLALSSFFRENAMLELILKKVRNPQNLRVVGSLKAFATKRQRGDCEGTVVFGPNPDLRADADDTFSLEELKRQTIEQALEKHDRVFYEGPFQALAEGLSFGDDENDLFFHEIVHYNPLLCSLTVVTTTDFPKGKLLNELELINPSADLTIVVTPRPEIAQTLRFERFGSGIVFIP